ncbi:MFS transporter [Saccharibacillus alkalitolerans]|uniref:YbfB/YjiJ family MFS transporter n=1 Tax=Saccharibacillus alkalitolerans TaxID=2705290 RepID=A0ABX0F252_9BACL|nr:MFS transporter [Saccharibacillus alkalitolerans]NGZ75067.1 YbfB/YjiJ family MFS transporter [Saccharibacillus alkalitolerans]
MKSILLPGMALVALCYAFARFAFGLFLPEISEELGIGSAAAGLMQALSYAAYASGLLSASFALRIAGTKRTLLLTALLAVAGLTGIALSPGPYWLAAGLFVAGVSTGWVSPALGHLVGESVEEARRDGLNARLNSGTSLGIAVSGPAALLLAGHWRGAYGLFALIGLLVIAALAKRVPYGSGRAPARTELVQEARRSGLLLPASLLTGAGSAVYWTYFMSHLQSEQGVSAQTSSLYWIAIGVAGLAGGLGGQAVRRFGLRRAYAAGVLLLSLSIAAVPLASPWINLLSAASFGAAYMFLTGLFILWGTGASKAAAAQISLSFLALGVGQAAGSWTAGGLIEAVGYDQTFLIFAAVSLAGLAIKPPVRNISQ